MSTILNIIIGFIVYIIVYSIIIKICDTVIVCFKIKYLHRTEDMRKPTNVKDIYPKE